MRMQYKKSLGLSGTFFILKIGGKPSVGVFFYITGVRGRLRTLLYVISYFILHSINRTNTREEGSL